MKWLTGIFLVLAVSVSAQSPELAKAPKGTGSNQSSVQACQQRLQSELCTKFEGQPGLMKPEQCAANLSMETTSVLGAFTGCVTGVAFSVWDFVKFIWEAIKFIGTAPFNAAGGIYNYLTDGDSRASTHESVQNAWQTAGDYLQSIYPYLATEFQKAYDGVSGPAALTPPTRAYAAMKAVSGKILGGLLSAAERIISAKVEELQCFDNTTRAQKICKLAGDIFFPPAAFFALIKHGVKGLKNMPALMNKLNDTFKVGQKSTRAQVADDVLGRKITPEQAQALEKAHKVGEGQVGLDGTPAKIGNYDKKQIDEKARILADAGFDAAERRKLLEEGIAGLEGNKTPFISYRDPSGRLAAQVLEETPDAVKLRVQGPDGSPLEKWVRKDQLIGVKDSSKAALAFERVGDPRVDRVRESVLNGKFDEADRYISFADPGQPGRASGRILEASPTNPGAVIIEEVTQAGLVRRELSVEQVLSARLSDTAKNNYKYAKQNEKLLPVPGVREPGRTELVKEQFKSQMYHKDDAPRIASRRAYDETFRVPTSPELTAIAKSEGRIVEHRAALGAQLKPGTYTYVITAEGRLITGQVDDVFEFGVKHSNLSRGRKIVSAGEIKINSNGTYSFNNESGSYAAELIKARAATREELEKRTRESLKVYLGKEGQFENRILLPEKPPSRENLMRYCRTAAFQIYNAASCCKVVGIGCN